MPKIKTISLSTPYASDLERALRAACSPFGSLAGPIPDLMIAYLGGPLSTSAPTCTIDAGIALLRELRAVWGEWSEVLLGASRVQQHAHVGYRDRGP